MLPISAFWTNTIWYLLLGIATIIELAFAIHKSENKSQTFAFFLTVIGATLFLEEIILIFLQGYVYYPKILTNIGTPFDDVIAGNFFSQFSVSATLVFVTERKMKFYWYFIFAVIYGLVEELFLRLGIFRHNWYQTWMTVVMLPVAFIIVKMMHQKLKHGIKPMHYYGYILLGLFPLGMITIFWSCRLAGIQNASDRVLADPEMSRQAIGLSVYFVLSMSLMFTYFSRLAFRWSAIVIIALYALYYFIYQLNLEQIRDGWFLPVVTAVILGMYFSVFLLDKLYGQPLRIPAARNTHTKPD